MYGFLLVMLGGSLGAALRYAAGLWVGNGASATLLVNLVGSLLLGGVAAFALARAWPAEQSVWLFLGVGLLGAFTTYSAFSRETVLMFLDNQIWSAVGYMVLNTVGAVAAFAGGFLALRGWLS